MNLLPFPCQLSHHRSGLKKGEIRYNILPLRMAFSFEKEYYFGFEQGEKCITLPIDICHLANYNLIMDDKRDNFGKIIKRQRVLVPLTLKELSDMTGISPSHLGRIERGERFPSARILRKIAKPLGFAEDELFTLAGYLSIRVPAMAEANVGYSSERLDPYVAKTLAQEPIEVQRTVIGILIILKSISKSMAGENR